MAQRDADFHRLSDAIQQIYSGASQPESAKYGLTAAATLIDQTKALILRLSRNGKTDEIIAQIGRAHV